MTMTTRRGFTLVELLVGLILLTAVGAVTYQLLVNTQRVSRSQNQHIGMQDNGRSGALIVANELREQGYDQVTAAALASLAGNGLLAGNALVAGTNSDLRAIGPDSITYRAPRGIGYMCSFTETGATTADVVVYNDNVVPTRKWQAYRSITSTDSLMLFVENNAKTAVDDLWLTVGLTANQSAQNCPDGNAGIRFRIQIPAGLVITALTLKGVMPPGNPVRAFELMQMRSYTSGGKVWLGMRSRPLTAGTTIQPVVGPLSSTANGLTFSFKDANDNVTTVADNVRSVQIALQPMSDEMVRTTGKYGSMTIDTATTRVSLRNALRP
jgi:prepilin-type N-terminal cleavage/methylation domain-containing protein